MLLSRVGFEPTVGAFKIAGSNFGPSPGEAGARPGGVEPGGRHSIPPSPPIYPPAGDKLVRKNAARFPGKAGKGGGVSLCGTRKSGSAEDGVVCRPLGGKPKPKKGFEFQENAEHFPRLFLSFCGHKTKEKVGEVREWLNRAVSKTVEPPGSGGSNPSLSATIFSLMARK